MILSNRIEHLSLYKKIKNPHNYFVRIFCAILIFFIGCTVFASDYGIYNRNSYRLENDDNEKILFILDFSNSMSEFLDGEPKYVLMLNTVKKLIAQRAHDVVIEDYAVSNGMKTLRTSCIEHIKNGNMRKLVRKMNSAKTKAISDLEDMM